MKDLTQPQTVSALRILYSVWVVVGMFSLVYVPTTLIDTSDAIATAERIARHSRLYRLSIAGSLVTQLLFIIIPALLYRLFETVDRNQAALMVVLAWVSVPITMYNEVNQLMVFGVLGEPDRIADLLEAHRQGSTIATIFWGLWLFPLGGLVYRSQYFPKGLSYFLWIGGVGYVFGSFARILMGEVGPLAFVLELMTMGEVVFVIWLVAVGVKRRARVLRGV